MAKWSTRIGIFFAAFLMGTALAGIAGWLSYFPNSSSNCEGTRAVFALPIDQARNDEWTVYLAVMKEEGLSPSQVLILDESSSVFCDPGVWTESVAVTTASNEADEDYRIKNRSWYSLQGLFGDRREASFITRAELDAFDHDYFWQEFHLRHPLTLGYMWFSRVGFNQQRTEAVVDFGEACGGLCGHSATWIFTKENGLWVKTGVSGVEFYS